VKYTLGINNVHINEITFKLCNFCLKNPVETLSAHEVHNGNMEIIKKKLENIQTKAKKSVADRLAESVGETPNRFGELDRDCQNDWL